MHIALSQTSPPLFYISTHSGFSSHPSIILHSSPTEHASPLATAQFHSFSRTIDLLLYQPGPAFSSACEAGDDFSFSMVFSAPVASAVIERFEWKNSAGVQVAALKGRRHGMELVLQRTGEVVAVWAPPKEGYKKKGKMSFVADRSALGSLMEVASVVSVVGVMEKRRRQYNNGAAAGAGGGGGGGGC